MGEYDWEIKQEERNKMNIAKWYKGSYNQGQKSLDRLSLFSSIHLFTALKWSFLSIVRWNCNSKPLSQNRIPPSHPLFQCCAQQWCPCQYENEGRGKSLVNMPEWSNTFSSDCRLCTVSSWSCSHLLENYIECVYWQDNPAYQVSFLFPKSYFWPATFVFNPPSS